MGPISRPQTQARGEEDEEGEIVNLAMGAWMLHNCTQALGFGSVYFTVLLLGDTSTVM